MAYIPPESPTERMRGEVPRDRPHGLAGAAQRRDGVAEHRA